MTKPAASRVGVAVIASLLLIFVIALSRSFAAVAWTGAAGTNWASGGSWGNGTGPAATDTITYSDTGSSNLPNDLTSLLNTSRSIAGLTFNNSASHFHTLDLNGQTLTVTGNANFNLDQSGNTTTTIRDGTLTLNSAFANLNVGRGVSGSAASITDFSGLSAFNFTGQNVLIGASSAGGANGVLTLGASNSITASALMQIGASNNSGDTAGTLHLPANSTTTILVPEIDVATNNSSATFDAGNGATVNIGSATARTILQIANQNTNTNNTYTAIVNFGNAAVNLHFDSLLVGQKNGGPGGINAQLLGGGSGSVAIGDPAARGNVYVGQSVNGGGATGTVDFSRLSIMNAYVTDFLIGNTVSGSGHGSVSLAQNSTLDIAGNLTVGQGGDQTNLLNLGAGTTTILVNQINVAKNLTNGTIAAPAGASVNIGSAARRANLFLTNEQGDTNTTYTGKLDLTGAAFNGYFNDFIIGQRQGGGGGAAVGTILGATSGAIDIGPSGNTANLLIGNSISGGAPVIGNVDLSGLSTMTASLNLLSLGTTTPGAGAIGTLKLPAISNISANSIVVGSNGENQNTLTLGRTSNTILTPQLTIAQDYSFGAVTLPTNSTLNLGSPAQRTSLTMASGNTNTNNNYTGSLDCSAGTLVAYLDNVILGVKNAAPGAETATFSISNKPGNHIEANSISIGGNASTGTINFAGGVFYIGSITPGTGSSAFNWTGGTLSVTTFGSPSLPLNLLNTGTGTLAPGTVANSIGTTQVYGNYTQGVAATLAVEIAGSSPSTGNDQLAVSGSATFGGTLNLAVINGFVPTTGQNFLIATYASHSGNFSFVSPPSLPQNVAFSLDTQSTQMLVHMVAPTNQNSVATGANPTFATASNWSPSGTPTTTSNLTIGNPTVAAQTITVNANTTVHRVTLNAAAQPPINLEVLAGVQMGISNQLTVGANASLTGGGRVVGAVVITGGGSISPGPNASTFAVTGDLNLQSGSSTLIDLGGTASTAHDLIDVSGQLSLAGDLHVSTINGYTPAVGDSFQILHFGSDSGQFDHLFLPPLASGMAWDTSALTTTGQIAVAVPEPATVALVAAAAIVAFSIRRRPFRHSPPSR